MQSYNITTIYANGISLRSQKNQIFRRRRLRWVGGDCIAYPAPHGAGGDELVAPLEMPQLAFPRAQLTPEISVDGIDI